MNEPIRSLQNARIKAAVKLRDRRGRQKQGRIIIDGLREITRAVEANVRLLEIYLLESRAADADVVQLGSRAAARGAEILPVTSSVFEKLAFGQRSEAVVAIAETPQRSLADLQLPATPLVAVLDALEKPGNVGAVLRSADGAGLDAVVLSDSRTDLFNPNTIRASLGTVFTLPVACAAAAEVAAWLRGHGLKIFAADAEGEVDYFNADLRQGAAIVLGSEAYGLSTAWRELATNKVRLPMLGSVDSLNVSVTAAVLFYEARRQRQAGA